MKRGVKTADGKIVVTAGNPTGKSYTVYLWNGSCEPIIMPIEK